MLASLQLKLEIYTHPFFMIAFMVDYRYEERGREVRGCRMLQAAVYPSSAMSDCILLHLLQLWRIP
jgi:hypothetical protein